MIFSDSSKNQLSALKPQLSNGMLDIRWSMNLGLANTLWVHKFAQFRIRKLSALTSALSLVNALIAPWNTWVLHCEVLGSLAFLVNALMLTRKCKKACTMLQPNQLKRNSNNKFIIAVFRFLLVLRRLYYVTDIEQRFVASRELNSDGKKANTHFAVHNE